MFTRTSTPRRGVIASSLGLASCLAFALFGHEDAPPPRVLEAPESSLSTARIERDVHEPAPGPEVDLQSRVVAAESRPSVAQRAEHPLTFVVTGPDGHCGDVPVGLLWNLDEEHQGLESVLRTDATGAASCKFVEPEVWPEWFYADLAFPTLGLSARPIPAEGGEVQLPMVLPAYVDFEVVEQDGLPLGEQVFVEVRVPIAREPGNRWHRVAIEHGRGRIPVQVGVPLHARVTTEPGRKASADLVAPGVVTESVSCRLELASGPALVADVVAPDGTRLVATALRLIDRDARRDLMRYRPQTDAHGSIRFRLPRRHAVKSALDVIATARIDGVLHYADLWIDGDAIHDGGYLGAIRFAPLPELVGGVVTDARGVAQHGIELVLELGTISDNPKREGAITWRVVGKVHTRADGTFAFPGLAPTAGELRLRSTTRQFRIFQRLVAAGDDVHVTLRDRLPSARARMRATLEALASRSR